MEIQKMVSKDVWAVINDNYEKGSYTIAITNLIQYANEIVREKSGLSLDNTKLMDAAFLGQNPKLKVNKFQTVTEKDIQSGVGDKWKAYIKGYYFYEMDGYVEDDEGQSKNAQVVWAETSYNSEFPKSEKI